jgi:hypothetical protein
MSLLLLVNPTLSVHPTVALPVMVSTPLVNVIEVERSWRLSSISQEAREAEMRCVVFFRRFLARIDSVLSISGISSGWSLKSGAKQKAPEMDRQNADLVSFTIATTALRRRESVSCADAEIAMISKKRCQSQAMTRLQQIDAGRGNRAMGSRSHPGEQPDDLATAPAGCVDNQRYASNANACEAFSIHLTFLWLRADAMQTQLRLPSCKSQPSVSNRWYFGKEVMFVR